MKKQKIEKWRRHLGKIKNEVIDLRTLRRDQRILSFVLNKHYRHYDLETSSLDFHFYRLHQIASAMAVRRLVKRNDQGVTLAGILKDMATFHSLAVEVYPGLPSESEMQNDATEIERISEELLALTDMEIAHVDSKYYEHYFTAITTQDEVVSTVLNVAGKYMKIWQLEPLFDLPVTEADVRQLYGHAWIDEDDEIPPELLEL